MPAASIFSVPPESISSSKPSGQPIVIAVIDTGIDYQHPELEPFLWKNPGEIPGDGIDNDGNGYIDDVYGWDFYHDDNTVCHYIITPVDKNSPDKTVQPITRKASPTDNDNHGTHLAGIIVSQTIKLQELYAANHDSAGSDTSAESAYSIQIMSLKVLGGGRSANSFGTGSITHTIQAIQYAEAMGADICCLSWGTSTYSSALEQAIRESGMLFVAAAGNAASDNDEAPVYPASFALDNLISVASLNEATGRLSAFSNYGASSVDLAAPGENIYSTVIEGYAKMSGTSMSAPYICAAAALLYASSSQLSAPSSQHCGTSGQLAPSGRLSAAQIKEALVSGGCPAPALEGYLRYPVTLDPEQSCSLLGSFPIDQAAPQLAWKTTYGTASLSVQIRALDTGGSGIRTIRYLPGRQTLSTFWHGTSGIPVSVIPATESAKTTEPTVLAPSGFTTTTAPAYSNLSYPSGSANTGSSSQSPVLQSNTLTLPKPGYYTFYLCDYAGNETIQVVPLWQIPAFYTL